MATSTGLASVFKGIGSGYLNAVNQGRRERMSTMTNMQRIKSDRSRNAIEALKLQAMQDENRLKRLDAASDRDYKYAGLNQNALNAALGEINRSKKEWEGLDEDSISTNVAALRNSLFQALGYNEEARPYGLKMEQIAGMVPMPGEQIPGQFTTGNVPGAVIDQGQGRGAIEGLMPLDKAAKEFPGVMGLQSGNEFNPQTGRFETFERKTLNPAQQGMVGMYGPPNIDALPQDQRDLGTAAFNMRGVPDSRFRKPGAQIPKDVVAFGEREAKQGQIPLTATYGMREQTRAKIEQQKASATLTKQRATDLQTTLTPRLKILEQKGIGLALDNKYRPFNEALKQATLAVRQFSAQVAANAESGRMSRFKVGQEFKERQFTEEQNMNQIGLVQKGMDTLGNLKLTLSTNAQAYATALKNGDKAGAAKILEAGNEVRGLYGQVDKWLKETSGNPQTAMVNVANAMASAEKAKERLSWDPTNQQARAALAAANSVINTPYNSMNFGSPAPLPMAQFIGTQPGLSPEALPYVQQIINSGNFGNGRLPDSAGAFGGGGGYMPGFDRPVGPNINPQRINTGGAGKPKPVKPIGGPGPKPNKPGPKPGTPKFLDL
jgi:hypothetical protein